MSVKKKGRYRKKRHFKRSEETIEEVLYWAKDLHGHVRIRLQFQVRIRKIDGEKDYVGLRGKSMVMSVRSPGIALQLVDYLEACVEKFVPVIDPEPFDVVNSSESQETISPSVSAISAQPSFSS